ncbi:hypothetical protein ACIBSW_06705 [Actinoplanes sp. NPDC049668]|uniref:hypothetical protein n=1 Tax=unclassified Actinoplanes TaxID=2626549 RepID=UPI0033AE554C
MTDKVSRIESWAVLGLKLAGVGAVAICLYRRTVAAHAALSATRSEFTEAIEATQREVAALHRLAADENVVYLRGWMDGNSGAAGQGRGPVA